MNNKKVQSILEEALEQEIPSSQIRLWPAIEPDLAAGKHSSLRQGEKMNTNQPHRVSRGIYTSLAVFAALLALAFVTPQGRALAQSVLLFFTRTESDTFYMEPSDLTFEDTTPFHAECGISIAPRCSVEQVRSKVEFEVKEPGLLPEGLHFIGSTGGPDFVELKYGYADRLDGNLHVIVEAVGKPSGIGTGIVAKSADVEEVQIGNLPGEFYTGVLFQDENGNVTWNPDDPTSTLRWEDGGSTYTLTYYSRNIPLAQEVLIAVAESMTLEPVVK